MRPTGTATSIARPEINNVPVNSGTAPNAPDAPTWSARIAVCGLHDRPNRKSSNDTCWKNRNASTNTDRKMPIVVRIATHEAAISSNSMAFSTRLRARNSGRTRRYAHASTRIPSTTTAARRKVAARRAQLGVALRRRGDLGARRRRRRSCLRRDCECRCRRARADRRAAPASASGSESSTALRSHAGSSTCQSTSSVSAGSAHHSAT